MALRFRTANQFRKPTRDRRGHDQGLAAVHLREQRGAHHDRKRGEEIPRRQAESGSSRLLSPQHGQRGAAHGVIEQAGDGGERHVPLEFAAQREGPDQHGKHQNRNVRRVKSRMNRGEGFREISLLGQSESDPRHAENLRAQISVKRDQRAHGDQGRAEGTNRNPRHVGQRTLAVRRVRKDSDHHPLNERVKHRADDQGGEQSKGSIAARDPWPRSSAPARFRILRRRRRAAISPSTTGRS